MELMNYPIPDRCVELTQLFERCSLRELQDVFPTIVQSVFGIGSGGLGWGLRATTKENSPMCFDILHDFFSPVGSMLRLCYRLLNESFKFEFNLDLLPVGILCFWLIDWLIDFYNINFYCSTK